MKEFIALFNRPIAEQIGWTLIHSLWQGLLIAGITIVALRFVPNKLAQVRYNISGMALLLIFVSTICTFLYEYAAQRGTPDVVENYVLAFEPAIIDQGETSITSSIQNFVASNKAFIVLAWIVGTFVFSVRLLGGWMYTVVLKARASLLHNEWTNRLHELRMAMGINRLVSLAESGKLDAPVVIGYLKPIVIVPIGMFSGLTPQEVETILLHELMHIKRNDYLLNIFQSIIETILFFNPFVWLLSAIIRREREHCCDDGVLTYTGSPLAYAYALTRLEEIRVAGPGLALSAAAGSRHELLDRIKRIMEKSVRKYSNADRIIPVALLIAGIVLASFLTIGTARDSESSRQSTDNAGLVPLDTPKKKKKEATYYRKSETIIDESGEPHEILTEEFSGDEDLRPLDDPSFQFDYDRDSAFAFRFPEMPYMMGFGDIPPLVIDQMPFFDFNFHLNEDTTLRNQRWKEFNEEFKRNFKERFNSFYEDHQEELELLMKDMETKFEQFDELPHERLEETMKLREDELRRHQEMRQHFREEDMLKMREENRQSMEQEMNQLRESMHNLDAEMKLMRENMATFEKELRKELVKDGYLKNDELLNSMEWSDNGDFTVNGKKIKKEHIEKYENLRRKYLRDSFKSFRRQYE